MFTLIEPVGRKHTLKNAFLPNLRNCTWKKDQIKQLIIRQLIFDVSIVM